MSQYGADSAGSLVEPGLNVFHQTIESARAVEDGNPIEAMTPRVSRQETLDRRARRVADYALGPDLLEQIVDGVPRRLSRVDVLFLLSEMKQYGPEANLFVDYSQIVELECFREGIWGTASLWGRVVTYAG
jgi:hypothetical protein